MSFHDLSVVYLISILILLLPCIGLYKMFAKAGIAPWKAFIPFLNTWEMAQKAGLKKHWFFWQLIPVVGWFISLWIFVEFVKLFGKFGFIDHLFTVALPLLYFPYLGYSSDSKYLGPEFVKKHKKSSTREWIDAAVFAIVAATLIRTFVFEAYTIPTSSMEKTLLINDFLFVSKFSYGPRIPNTPLAMPFVHHTIPVLNSKSYVEWIKIPYTRWFASPVKRNDVVVFNFPAGDTLTTEYDSKWPYYDMVRAMGREKVWNEYTVTTRPVDKRENYIKRCTGIAGDTLQLKEGLLYVNGQAAYVAPGSATYYNVKTNRVILDEQTLRDNGIRLNMEEGSPDLISYPDYNYKVNCTLEELAILKKLPGIVSVTRDIDSTGNVYPYDPVVGNWTVDNYGPIWIPKKGATIPLTPQNIAIYKRAIKVYEGNEWEERDGKVYINGEPADHYTFKMNYYWMMGDNRHKSQDSRYWGFVPEDHIVGEAGMIWMSWEKGIRWNRLFRIIH